ncbi:hypothetical protein TeGR_g10607 [Tetraparma gracilis]|uniref:Uncharacterized protein n=1 Tax=Tetraparma gracilis TaxID=2962635 RepID=A0ABQ6MDB6_9STRA|nr:hypothetical protein TeGR_g10607 [Tetraparma gracilis]
MKLLVLLPLLSLSLAQDAAEELSSEPPAPLATAEMTITPMNAEGGAAPPFAAVARVYPGEDPAAGAYRFAEEFFADAYVRRLPDVPSFGQLFDIVARLEQGLPGGWEAPAELARCGKRPCTAGKLWKRAEENRKAGFHDSQGADLLRALAKNGLEEEFVGKCERGLARSFEGVGRQREREAREAEEDAKNARRARGEEEAMENARQRKVEYEQAWASLVARWAEAPPPVSAELRADGSQSPVAAHMPGIVAAFAAGEHEAALSLIRKVPGNDKTSEIWIIEARAHEVLGAYPAAMQAAGNLVQKSASHEPWISGSPRMLAVALGANAAMQLGMSDKALKFYQSVLKFDPDQETARVQYRGLKKVIKALGSAEEQIQKGYNKAASGHIDDCLSALKGLDVDSPLFRSKIQLKLCTILSSMDKHEEALSNCDSAVRVRTDAGVQGPDIQEAHLKRGEARLLDDDYDGAVSDFRTAFDLVPDDESSREKKRELQVRRSLACATHIDFLTPSHR